MSTDDATTVEVTVERRLDAPTDRVWDALADVEVIEATLPGCDDLDFGVERDYVEAGDQGTATLSVDAGPVSPSFATEVTVVRRDYPEMTVTAEGEAAAGSFATTADLAVADADEGTDVTWEGAATVSGGLAAFAGALRPLVGSVAERFFDRLDARLSGV